MLKNTYEDNENKKVNSREINILKENFPQYFNKNGDFKIDEFKKMLKDDEVNFDKEGYRLDFLGKSYARFESALETETVITPDNKHNNEEINKNSENMYIVGDNIDALKHLLKSYSGKVKCIYIDPPYNTGSDGFVYPDNFKFDKDTLSNKMGVSEEEADRILSLQGKSTHSAWLTFMYPRLLLARDLLADDGVIFISIDDNEQANLKVICDEIFGEENSIGTFTRITKKGGKSSEAIAKNHDFVISYAKNIEKSNLLGIYHTDKNYKFKDKHYRERGLYKLNQTLDYDSLQYSPSLDYPIKFEDYELYPGGSRDQYINRKNGNHKKKDWAWRWSESLFKFGLKNDFIVFKDSNGGSKRIYTKTYQKVKIFEENGGYKIKSIDRTKPMSSLELTNNRYSNDYATKEFDMFGDDLIFSYPKPTTLLKTLFQRINLNSDDIILDFFSGSSSSADAVMQINALNKKEIKYIMIQLDQEFDNANINNSNYSTIDELGRERIKRAAEKIRKETNADIDYGFKLYRLNEPTVQTIDKLIDFNPSDINFNEDDYVSNFEFNGESGKDTILTTWLNEDGYGLLVKAEPLKIGNYEADKYKNSLYIIDPGIKSSDIIELIKLLEKNQLDINRVVAYGYSLNFNIANELRNNLKNLKNNQSVNLIERY